MSQENKKEHCLSEEKEKTETVKEAEKAIDYEKTKSSIRKVLTILGTLLFSFSFFEIAWLSESNYNQAINLIMAFVGVVFDVIAWISGLKSKDIPTTAKTIGRAITEVCYYDIVTEKRVCE